MAQRPSQERPGAPLDLAQLPLPYTAPPRPADPTNNHNHQPTPHDTHPKLVDMIMSLAPGPRKTTTASLGWEGPAMGRGERGGLAVVIICGASGRRGYHFAQQVHGEPRL